MNTMSRLLLAAASLCPVAATAMASSTPTSMDVCTPRPDPLAFTVHIEPAAPQVGEEVRVMVYLAEVDGLLLGNASISLGGAAPIFGRDPQPIRQEGLFHGPVIFVLQAQVGGAAELSVTVNYETECACPPACYYRRTVVSRPFPVTVLGPTATPTAQCTPPVCVEGEVPACPGACPGGCGTICATRTPTQCPTPPCGSDETLFCPDACPGTCGAVCATRTQTPIPTDSVAAATATVAPTAICAGDCDEDGAVTIDELLAMVNVALGTDLLTRCEAADVGHDGLVDITDLVTAVNRALDGCSTAAPTHTRAAPSATTPPPTPTETPVTTPTSCRAVIPVVAPVVSPTDRLEQTIVLCGIGYASSRVNACGPAGCVAQYIPLSGEDCPLDCPDSRQACVAGVIPLLPGQANAVQVCQVPGIGCGPLPDLCAEEDVNGDPLVIEQRAADVRRGARFDARRPD